MILFGSTGTYDWNIEPKDKHLDNLNVWPAGLTGHVLQQSAVEYPVGSLKFVICGGADQTKATWLTTEKCHQLSQESVALFDVKNTMYKDLLCFRFHLLDNLWTNFASLLISCSEGILKVVGGVLFSFGGIHRYAIG